MTLLNKIPALQEKEQRCDDLAQEVGEQRNVRKKD